jgi:hypothetical protein
VPDLDAAETADRQPLGALDVHLEEVDAADAKLAAQRLERARRHRHSARVALHDRVRQMAVSA